MDIQAQNIDVEVDYVDEEGNAHLKTSEYIDFFEAGIIDPTKVTRCALENAVSIAGTILLTECTLVEKPKEKTEESFGGMPGMY